MNYPHIPLKLQKDPKLPSFLPFFLAFLVMLAIMILIFFGNAKAEEINLDIITKIESNNNPLAYNAKTGASGMYQITPICLKDYNQWHKGSEIALNALFKPVEARKVAEWYLDIRIPQMLKYYIKDYSSIKNIDLYIIGCYNWGIGNIVKWHKQGTKFNRLPIETQKYWRKYVALNKSK